MQTSIQDPFSRFEFGIKAEETRQKYVRRLEIFFDFYNVEGKTIKEKSENFLKYIKLKNVIENNAELCYYCLVLSNETSKANLGTLLFSPFKKIKFI